MSFKLGARTELKEGVHQACETSTNWFCELNKYDATWLGVLIVVIAAVIYFYAVIQDKIKFNKLQKKSIEILDPKIINVLDAIEIKQSIDFDEIQERVQDIGYARFARIKDDLERIKVLTYKNGKPIVTI